MGHPLLLGWLGAGPGSSAGLSIALGFRAIRLLSLGWPGGEVVWLDGKRMGSAEWPGGALTAVGRPGKPDWTKRRERKCLEIRGRRLLISNGKVSDLSASCTEPVLPSILLPTQPETFVEYSENHVPICLRVELGSLR